MPKSLAQKSFFQFVNELNHRSVGVDGSQLFSKAENAAGRQLLPKRKRGEQDVVPSSAQRQSRIDAIRKEFAALYIDLDARIAKLAKKKSAGRNHAPSHDPELSERLQVHAPPEMVNILAEGDQLLSQTKSAVLRIIGSIQTMHREVLGDNNATSSAVSVDTQD